MNGFSMNLLHVANMDYAMDILQRAQCGLKVSQTNAKIDFFKLFAKNLSLNSYHRYGRYILDCGKR